MSAVGLSTFLRDRSEHMVSGTAPTPGYVDFGAPRLHFESVDSWTSLEGCMQWRAELRLSALDAPGAAPEVAVGVIDFLVAQAGYENPHEVLPLYGERAAAFIELFDQSWLDRQLDESDDFTGGLPISTVLMVLDAQLDGRLPPGPSLRAWSVAQTIHFMLPTTAGLVLMPALPGGEAPRHRLVPAADLDADWQLVGCPSVPGHPRFCGQATAYAFLEEAREALAVVRGETIRIPLQS